MALRRHFALLIFLPKKRKYQIALTEIPSLTLAGERSWLLNNQQFLKHKIDNARHISLHRDSIIVLGHSVHRAFDLEAPIKHGDRRHHLIYQTR